MRAMEVQPDDFESVAFLAQSLQALGRTAEADNYTRICLKRAEQALRLNPENSRSAQLIANAYALLGESHRAKEWIPRSFEIDPDDNHGATMRLAFMRCSANSTRPSTSSTSGCIRRRAIRNCGSSAIRISLRFGITRATRNCWKK